MNVAPVIASTPIASAVLGSLYQYAVAAEDADADPLAYALLDAPIGMSIHPSLGTLRWTPAADQLGESDVSVQVTDPDGASVIQAFKLKVSRSGGPPAITSIPPTEAAVGVSYLYTIAARDAENDPLVYRLLAAPAGMTIVPTTGALSWTPLASQLGQQDVVIEVSDGIGGAVTQAFAIRVAAGVPNLPPVINTTAPRFGSVGTAYSYSLQATDPESTALTYSIGQGPVGMTVGATSGQVNWTPAVGQTGKFFVTLIATDAGGASAIESFELDVLAANSLPTIISTAPLEVPAGALFTYQVIARDANLDQLSYALTASPVGASIDSFGKITWPTTVPLIGSHDFTVRVSDPRGGVATQAFTLSVIEDVVPPKVSLIESLGDANRNILPWQGPFIVYARAIDNVAVASLTLTANGQDIPLSAAGTATFTFEDWAFQQINAIATAVDTNGNITTRTISFDYDFPEGWSGAGTADIPTVAITSPTDTAAVFGMVSIRGTASHANFAGYKLSYRRIDETTYTQFFESTTAVVNGQLGTWDTSLLINDEYVIRLEAATNSGVVNVVEHNVGLSGELKLGNFQLAFTDMVIPVAGIPIEITRIYDTLQADREGDFGYGWRLEYRNTDLRVGLPKSGLEDIGIYSPLREGVKVYLNVPGVGRQGFTFKPDIRVLPGFGGNNLVLARPRFTPDRGVTSTLATGTSGYLQVNERGELFAPGGIPYNPASPDFGGAYVLTTREGVRYRINGQGDLTTVTDRNNNTLTFSDSGVTGPGGTSINFERDAQGRITAALDPLGNAVRYGYSSNGDLTRVTDREGHATSFSYRMDRAHYLETVIDPLGRTGVRSEYDASGRFTSVLDGNGDRVTISYDPNNQLVTTFDGLNRPTTVEYDNDGNIVASTDALGNTTRMTFDTAGNILSVTDPLGRTMRMTYDAQRNQTSVTDPNGAITRTTYDAQDNPLTVVDPLGNIARMGYDRTGNVTSMIDASGNNAQLGYSGDGRLTSLNAAGGLSLGVGYGVAGPISGTDWSGLVGGIGYDANGRPLTRTATGDGRTTTVSATYDAEGRVRSQTDESGAVTLLEYDAADQLVAAVNPLGERTTYTYDGIGRVVEVTRPDGVTLRTSFDAAGQVTSRTDAAGRITRFEYDAAGRMLVTLFPDSTPSDDSDNPRVRIEYDAAGQVVATIDELGRRTTFTYDATGRQTATTDPLGRTVSMQYDAAGRVASQTDPLNRVTFYSYDAAGRSTGIRFADGTSVATAMSDRNIPALVTNELGQSTRLEYNAIGQLVAVVDPLGNRTDYAYDTRGKLVSQTDANGHVTRFEYDAVGRQTVRVLPGGQRWQTEYNLAGQVIRTTDPDNRQAQYSYDQLGRISSKTLPGGAVVSYSYTLTGQLATISEPRGVTRYEYDSRDRLTLKVEPDGQTITYQYDAASQLIGRTTLAGTVIFSYNTAGELTSVTDEIGGVTSYTFDAAGQLVRVNYPNGVVEDRTYDLRGRVIRVNAVGPGGVLTDFRYTLDAHGRIVQTEELGRSMAYSYDAANRLIDETTTDVNGTTAVQYEYDAVGNRLRRMENGTFTNYIYDINDRLTRQNSDGQITDYTYDASGNQLSAVTGTDRTDYTWDDQRRLVSARVTTGGIVRTESYRHDDAGVRVGVVTADGTETRLLVDTSGPLSIVLAQYTPAGTLISSRVGMVEIRGGIASVLLGDRLGSVRVVTNATGNAVSSFNYDAYGRLVSSSGTSTPMIGYAGEPRDSLTGLDYLRARSYDPSTGRFVSADPFVGVLVNPLSRHRYQYADLNPVSNTDPLGLQTYTELSTVGKIRFVLEKSTIIQTGVKVLRHAREYAGVAETVIVFGAATVVTTVHVVMMAGAGQLLSNASGNAGASAYSFNDKFAAKTKYGLIDKIGISGAVSGLGIWSFSFSLTPFADDGTVAPSAGIKYDSLKGIGFTGEAAVGWFAKYYASKGVVTGVTFKKEPENDGVELLSVTLAGKASFETYTNGDTTILPKLAFELGVLGMFKYALDIIPGLIGAPPKITGA